AASPGRPALPRPPGASSRTALEAVDRVIDYFPPYLHGGLLDRPFLAAHGVGDLARDLEVHDLAQPLLLPEHGALLEIAEPDIHGHGQSIGAEVQAAVEGERLHLEADDLALEHGVSR